MENQTVLPKGRIIKSLYFYLVSFVALMMLVFSTSDIINIALKTWVFTQADKNPYTSRLTCQIPANPLVATQSSTIISQADCDKENTRMEQQEKASYMAQKQQNVVRDISLIAVGIPLFLIHWRILRRKDENL